MPILSAILDQDGSCRDINFDRNITLSGVKGVLRYLSKNWELKVCTNSQGELVSKEQLLISSYISTHSNWVGNDLINQIQLYTFKASDDKYFTELSFFPSDVNREIISEPKIKSFIKELKNVSNSEKIFLRYENASWDHGTMTPDIILSHLDL